MKAKLATCILAGVLMSTGASAAECGSAVAEYVYSGNPALHAHSDTYDAESGTNRNCGALLRFLRSSFTCRD